jgi:hypothetical protein
MNEALHSVSETAIGACTYSNEDHLRRAILPERFESTSVPDFSAGAVVELELGDQYTVPSLSETPVIEVSPVRE